MTNGQINVKDKTQKSDQSVPRMMQRRDSQMIVVLRYRGKPIQIVTGEIILHETFS